MSSKLTSELSLYSKVNNKTFIHTLEQGFNNNTIDFVKTNISTTAKQIVFPEQGNQFIVIHKTDSGIMYVNKDENVATSDFPMNKNDILEISGRPDFNLWGITSSGSVDVFVITAIKE